MRKSLAQAGASMMMSSKMKFFFSRIFPFIFVFVGAIIVFFGVRGLIKAQASVDWPSSSGKIVASSVEHHRSTGEKGATYHADILYEFSVGGTVFNGTRVAYGDYGSSSPSHARRIVNRYPEKKVVTVYYMPENPEECLLEPGVKLQAWFLPGLGLVFFTVGCLIAYFPRPKKTSDKRDQIFATGPDA